MAQNARPTSGSDRVTPGAMSFHSPSTLDAALKLLATLPEAKCLAGGATLVAMMNADLVVPRALISLRGIAELAGAERRADGSVRIGAMRRHRETAFETRLERAHDAVGEAARQIANPPVRNMGTLGGAIAFADPAADYPPALVAADAAIEIAGPGGPRSVAADAFFMGYYETALRPGEIVTAAILPPAPPGSAGAYEKLARVAGDYAIASAAVTLVWRDGRCVGLRAALGACGPKPVRVPEAERLLVGTALDEAAVRRAGALLAEACDPVDDVRASAAYRRKVAPRLFARALRRAQAKAAA